MAIDPNVFVPRNSLKWRFVEDEDGTRHGVFCSLARCLFGDVLRFGLCTVAAYQVVARPLDLVGQSLGELVEHGLLEAAPVRRSRSRGASAASHMPLAAAEYTHKDAMEGQFHTLSNMPD